MDIHDADKALDLYRKHVNKEINISKEIWKWINLELWFREFIDQDQQNAAIEMASAVKGQK